MKNYSVLALVAAIVIMPCTGSSQVAPSSVSTVSTIVVSGGTSSQTITAHSSSVNGVQPGSAYTVKYNNNANVNISSFTSAGKTYVKFAGFDTIMVRRAANAWETTNGNKQHIYCQGNSTVDNSTYQMPFPVAFPQTTNYNFMERVMKEGLINRGSDNVFNNDAGSDLTYNNIERVDFVYKAGISTTSLSAAGFMIAERGGNDPFKVAAITAIDANGNPTAFSSVLSVNTSSYGSAIISIPTYVMRKDASDNNLRPFSMVSTQAVRSVFIRFSDLGITALQKVYGYALMGNDVTATTSAQILDYTNTTYFPRTTTTADGGMDMASAPGIFHTDLILDVNNISISSQTRNCEPTIQWNDEDYLRIREFQLERSADGTSFTQVAVIPSGNNAFYSYTDKSFRNSGYYRVKAIETNGRSYYSSMIYVKNNCGGGNISLYPNPVQDKLNISFNGEIKADMVILVAADGRECGKWTINDNTQLFQMDISSLPRGQYFVKLTNGGVMMKALPVLKK
ncbi:MAG: T9SS type A sorting domain-containing protein [Chitinophagaceae bacterium]|nr:T9SS type A sorting domain-containing protein [Chitinophagaceae bacterium]